MAQFFELSFELGSLDVEAAEAACRASGAVAVTLCAAREEEVLEPGPGELKLWEATRVQALYEADRADAALIVQLATRLGIAPQRLCARAVRERVWEREWLRDFHAMRFGKRLWVSPHHEHVSAPEALVVNLDPGLAFGTGTHPSTALCLQWLDAAARTDANFGRCRVIDYGCGSGILGIAALRLGAERVFAHDNDPQALLATHQNALANAVAGRLEVCERAEQLPQGCGLLMANILAPVLQRLSARFAALLGGGARLLLAGLLVQQTPEMTATFGKWFDIEPLAPRDGWVALCGVRRDVPA